MEIRTKSTNFHSISDLSPTDRVLLAWTLSPEEVASRYEHDAPPPKDRLAAAKHAVDRGWFVRVCFDPVIPVSGWRDLYAECVETAFSTLPIDRVRDATVGSFRMSSDHLRVARRNRPENDLLHHDWSVQDGTAALPLDEREEIAAFMKELILKWLPEERIFIWT